MKKKISLMIAVILLLQILLPMLTVIWESGFTIKSVAADVIESWDISATEDDNVMATLYNNGLLEITGTGAMKSMSNSSSVPWYSNREDIQIVTISEGVTSIGTYAFCYCESLAEIKVDENNQYYSSEDGVLFNKEKTLLIQYPVGNTRTSYTTPEGLTNIGIDAFEYCKSLTSIEISEGVKSIGSWAFRGCSNLTFIKIPGSVNDIRGSITSGNPGNVGSATSVFYGCYSLKNIAVDENNQNYSSENGILFNKDKTIIMCYPAGKTETEYTIPNSVTFIYGEAFYGCRKLVSVTIPTSVTKIGHSAFEGCWNLTNITIPNSVVYLGSHSFASCISLNQVAVPKEVKFIGAGAFNLCGTLTNIEIPKEIEDIRDQIFYCCTLMQVINIDTDKEEVTIELPYIIKRTLDENDNLYAGGKEPSLRNCNISMEDETITFNMKDAQKNQVKVTINGGPLSLLTIVLSIKTLENIEIMTPPNNTEYIENEKLDKTGMIVKAIYTDGSSKEVTNYKITPDEGTVLTTNNDKIVVSYTEGDVTKKAEQQITVSPITLTSEEYIVEETRVRKLQPETTVEEFKENIETNATLIEMYNTKGEKLEETDIIGTGATVRLNNIKNYTLLVLGDVNGDSKADFRDILTINKHRLGQVLLEEPYKTAGDINEDGKVDFMDILQINKYRLGTISSL